MDDLYDTARSIGYELFVTAITLLSFVNFFIIVISSDSVWAKTAEAMDLILAILLLGDFLIRLIAAKNRVHYLTRGWGWADFLGSLPFPGVRAFRIVRLIGSWRRLKAAGLSRTTRDARRNLSSTTLAAVALLLVLLVEFGSMTILYEERKVPNSDIRSGDEAIWFSVVTLATVGYGDYVPVTNAGRSVAILTMVLGVGLTAVITGFLANTFLNRTGQQSDADESIEALASEVRELRETITRLTDTIDSQSPHQDAKH